MEQKYPILEHHVISEAKVAVPNRWEDGKYPVREIEPCGSLLTIAPGKAHKFFSG